ncbi:hypothetical protein [Actinoplanes solisilvae]|uniref:hypothetical protein n=1 Tax=Actinoplanes solisilvae TaxID=2486853 RepID=UPI000FD88E16|nr:hypothetical protein [Actinoplanes solisilvae]
MSETPEPGLLGPPTTLFDHALRLRREHPDEPLPRDGYPFPDEERHRSRTRPTADDPRRAGADVAAVLDRHFGRSDSQPSELADAFHDLYVPIHRNEHIAAAALRANRKRVRRTGRWLVRHSTDRCAATVGLALLAADWDERDISLIQVIGLLSNHFGPLAADALQRRRGGEEALQWLAERVAGWGRVYVIEALCRRGVHSSRSWLLRHACDGDYLNGYFAGQVATAAHLHAAITGPDVDDELIDHTGLLLSTMADCGGMGRTLQHYPPAPTVLAAHAAYLFRQTPTWNRYVVAATLADHLAAKPANRSGCTAEERDDVVRQYLAALEQPDWVAVARAGLDPAGEFGVWFAGNVAARLRLSAFVDQAGGDDR